jgi:hypothetical protein
MMEPIDAYLDPRVGATPFQFVRAGRVVIGAPVGLRPQATMAAVGRKPRSAEKPVLDEGPAAP